MKYAGSSSAGRFALFFNLAVAVGCSRSQHATESEKPPPLPSVAAAEPAHPPVAAPACDAPIPVYEDGRAVRSVCAESAAAEGLTVIDLSDDFVPRVFDEDPALGAKGKQPYRSTMVALENEDFSSDAPELDRAKSDRFLELYGIFPSIGVIAKRLADAGRHVCHAGIDRGPLERQDRTLNAWRDRPLLEGLVGHVRELEKTIAWEEHKRGFASLDEARKEPKLEILFRDYDRSRAPIEAVGAVQDHLACDGLVNGKTIRGVLDYGSSEGLQLFQRKHMIVSWELDRETKQAFLTDSRELDFRTLLRALRERVVDATGLIEDGSARGEPGLVVGRTLDSEAFRPSQKDPPRPDGAPDLVAAATDAAARAFGWTSPEAASTALASHPMRVAVKLPPLPSYHSASMDLRVEIDRGDVYYDYPFTKEGLGKIPPVEHRPTLTLIAKDGDHDVALIRWPTTIGGWKPEKIAPRLIEMKYKESPVGSRVWKDLIVTPVWIPPDTAPKRELVRARGDGSWVLNTDLFGPGYASAFGLVKLVHHRVAKLQNAKDPVYYDEGIGTHGSVSYDSIHHGTSHGCHRLQNHVAIRLGGFLLRHRPHETKGTIELGYGRSFPWQGRSMTLKFDTGGYRYELTPPVPIEVLRGRIMTSVTSPPRPKPLPDSMMKLMVQERFED